MIRLDVKSECDSCTFIGWDLILIPVLRLKILQSVSIWVARSFQP